MCPISKFNGREIWLGEQSKQGATFYFTIEADRIVENYTSEMRVVEPALRGRKILVVIDNNTSCGQVLHQRLTELGMSVASVETSEQALSPDSIIPVVDVVFLALERSYNEIWEYISMLRKQHGEDNTVPAILFVNHDDSLLRRTDTGLYVHLERPLMHKQLVEKLTSLFFKQPAPQQTLITEPNSQKVCNPSILVVDDNLINQHVILHLLQDTECKVNMSSNGHEALEMIRHVHFDIIFIDIHMPDMDGLTLARKIHVLFSPDFQPWLIAMTANSSDDIQQKSINAGMKEVAFKPVLLDTLERIIVSWQKQYDGNKLPAEDSHVKPCLLNMSVLNNYRLATLEELCKLFSKSGTDYVDKLKALCGNSDMENISQAAHVFKGSALTMGAGHLSDLCAELQLICDQHQIEKIDLIMDKISYCYSMTMAELDRQVKMKKQMLNYR